MTQTTLREYLRTTEDAISSGRIDEAMANCQNVLTSFPEALEAQHLLGEVYLAQGQLEEAQQTFEWILTNDPENVIVYCDRALISERTSDIDTALDCYQQAYELSRGNANIRQEFNQLSARAGQPEFMFSRAGLARLYMRGNLLTQAIQEWEAVLAISPERLDARLGLIETYWREGLFDKAEQLATQILEEIPTCLKALLYLAHIVSISNITHARDLVRRAETLDPELRMAQEIFAELFANQPNDPFLRLIQKEPILLENGVPINRPLAPAPTPVAPVEQPAPNQSTPFLGIPSASPLPPTPSGADWNVGTQAPSGANWSNGVKAPSGADWTQNQSEPALSSRQEQLEPLAAAAQGEQREQPWYEHNQYAAASAAPTPNWENLPDASADQQRWDVGEQEQEEEQAAQPDWLNTLARNEQAAPEIVPTEPEPTPFARPQAAQQEEAMPFFFSAENEEGDGGTNWPAWLKSLGAESLEPDASAELPQQNAPASTKPEEYTGQAAREADPWAEIPTSNSSQPDWMHQLTTPAHDNEPAQPAWMNQFSTPANEPTQPDWMQQFSSPVSEPAQPAWMNQFAASAESQPAATPMPAPMAEQEQRYIASLEDLEKSLQAQGFAPLAPGSLASIAQSQTSASAPAQPQEQPSLSSALAQLGNFSQPPVAPTASGEPWWNSMLAQSPEQPTQAQVSSPSSPAPDPFAALSAHPSLEATSPMPALPATPAPTPLAPTPFQPSTNQTPATHNPPLTPTYRSDALLDSDLETTMKRPAVQLQPMQAGDRPYPNGKGYASERPPVEHGDDSKMSNRERLVRGYQSQLSGAYDEAMSDYRLIIRNAPELLDDVISNMRALLKFNPRFSVGYRVLGDAYMRKGEYLQAMESYNKALTMAKKTRS